MGNMVQFSTADSGYLATPVSGSGPGVVVIQEWWGLVDHIKSVADRFAAAGFVALRQISTTAKPQLARTKRAN